VTPCAAKRKRDSHNRKRAGPSCGFADFLQRASADEELQGSFSRSITDQAWRELDEGYTSGGEGPAADPGWEGDGGHEVLHEGESDYASEFSDDVNGLFEGAQGAEGSAAGETVEGLVFSSAEEAAAIAAGLSAGGEAEAATAGAFAGMTVTAGSFLAIIWNGLSNGQGLSNANTISKESIHKITKTKTATKSSSSTSGCPAATATPVSLRSSTRP
jgi:hypothetical protein